MHRTAWCCGNAVHTALRAGKWEGWAHPPCVGLPSVTPHACKCRKLGGCFLLFTWGLESSMPASVHRFKHSWGTW